MKNSDNKKVITMFKHNNTSATIMSVADSFDMRRGGKLNELDIKKIQSIVGPVYQSK